jgi:type VI secretion system protein ImpC
VDLSKFLESTVRPHIVPAASSQQTDAQARVNATATEALRYVLHEPAFQALEATWLSIRAIVSQLESDSRVQIHLLDVTRQELMSDLCGANEWRATTTYRLVVESDLAPWSLLLADVAFGARPEDIAALAMLGGLAAESQAPFLAAADPALAGCPSLTLTPEPRDWTALPAGVADLWQQLRRSELAAWIGLVAPRILLRQPYGAQCDPIDTFPFEELADADQHEHFLWASGALACGRMACCAWDSGDDPHAVLRLDGMPVFNYTRSGESQMKPCAEVFLSERALTAFLDAGVMPLASVRNQDAVQLVRWQSIAQPARQLAGV